MKYPRLPIDKFEFELNFLPFEDRKCGRDGIVLYHMYYRGKALTRLNNVTMIPVRIRYDPDDIRIVYLFVEGEYQGKLKAIESFKTPLSLERWKLIRSVRSARCAEYEEAPNGPAFRGQLEIVTRDAKRHSKALAKGCEDYFDDIIDLTKMKLPNVQ